LPERAVAFNILRTARGVGFAIRLLPSFETTLESLNLAPGFQKICRSFTWAGVDQRPDRQLEKPQLLPR